MTHYIRHFHLWLLWIVKGRAAVHGLHLELNGKIDDLQRQLAALRNEVAMLKIAQYVPPSQPEEKVKVIRTQTFKQFTDILEREQENSNAV